MPTVHPTATLDGEVELADDVVIGPHCVVTGPVTMGPGCRLIGHVYLQGPLWMGAGNVVYPFTCLGFAPQHARFDPGEAGRGLRIGDGNTFREHVTINRAFESEHPTEIGDRNWFMATSHAGHDCRVGSDCVLVNGALLAGHVTVGDRCVLGGSSLVHQNCRLGRGVMISGSMGTGRDVPPWFMVTGINLSGSLNLVGLRRSGLSREEVDDVRWAYRVIARGGRTAASTIEALREREDRSVVREYIEFIEGTKRGLIPTSGQEARNVHT